MLRIFRTLVDIYGYPGDNFADWVDLVRKGKDLLTAEEHEQAVRWVNNYPTSNTLQCAFRAMKS